MSKSSESADVPTVAAIAMVSYVVASMVHEGLGHGGVCVISGGRPIAISSVHFECDGNAPRMVSSAGTLANLLVGGLCLALLRVTRSASARTRYFLWLSMTVNLFQGGGYFLFSGVANIGDWASIIEDLEHRWAYRMGLTALGAASYWFFVRLALFEMRDFIGTYPEQRLRLASR